MGILGAFILAILVALLFSPNKSRDSIAPLMVLFFILFFAGLSAQFWIVPFGPVLWGVAWFPVFFIILIFALLFSVPPPRKKSLQGQGSEVDTTVPVIGVFVWILFIILAIAAIAGLYNSDIFE